MESNCPKCLLHQNSVEEVLTVFVKPALDIFVYNFGKLKKNWLLTQTYSFTLELTTPEK